MFRFNNFSLNAFSLHLIGHVTSVRPITFLFQLIQVDTKEINKHSGTKSYFSTSKRHKIPRSDTHPGYLLEDINRNVRSVAITDVSQHAASYWTITSGPSELVNGVAGFVKNTRADGAWCFGGSEGGWEWIEMRDCGRRRRRMNDRSGASAKRV